MTQEPPPDEAGRASISPEKAAEAAQSLRRALWRARADDAERSGIQAELRAAQFGRLELLQEALEPLLSQIPADAGDLFDVGIMPGETPRLFVDMIGFVEMARDTRFYRLCQDTRHNRLTLAESVEVAPMVDAVTQYVARRLLERQKALASSGGGATAIQLDGGAPRPRKRSPWPLRWAGVALAFTIDLLGAIAFLTILAAAGWLLWSRLHGA